MVEDRAIFMKTIGKYQVLEEIGSSAAAKLYRVRDRFRTREVALKVYDTSLIADLEAQDRFRRELGACTELRHPHIAPILDAGEAGGEIFVVTELLNGVDLQRHFRQHRVLPLETKLEVIARVCDALSIAHRAGIAHGNIRPSNVWIGAGEDVRVLDFGSGRWIATALISGARLPRLSVHYFAPEQVLGDFFDARSDVYSVGMVAYHLLADRYPFDVAEGVLPREIVNSDPPLLGTMGAWIPGELEQFVARALRKDPAERVQTVHEFANGLRRIAEQMSKPLAAVVEAPRPTMTLTSVPKEPPVAQPVAPAAMEQVLAQPVVAQVIAQQPTVQQVQQSVAPPAVVPATPQPAAEPAAAEAGPPSMPPMTIPPLLVTRPQPAKPPSRPKHSRKRTLTYIAGGLIAIGLSGAFLIRNGVHGSPAQPSVTPLEDTKVAEKPAATPPVQQQPAPVPVVQASTQATPVAAQTPDEKAKLDLVKSLWESGQYTPALRLVDEVLAANAASADGRSWRRKIRAAQQAEAELK